MSSFEPVDWGGNSLRETYSRYAVWLRRRLIRQYGEQDADDISQDTWIKFLLTRGRVAHPKALLIAISRSVAIDSFRRQRRASDQSAKCLGRTIHSSQSDSQVEDLAFREIVLGLPQPLRDVFVLKRFGGLTNAQVAEELGISPKTVEWRMTKALAHCAAQLRA